jgi:hypothetical protein
LSALAASAPALRIGGARIATAALGGLVLLSGFVMVEPAPYDFGVLALIVVWSVAGLKLNRHILPLTILLML